MRVKIADHREIAVVSGEGLTLAGESSASPTLRSLIGGQSRVEILCDARSRTLVVTRQKAGAAPQTWRFPQGNLTIESQGGFIFWDGKPYRSRLAFHVSKDKGCDIINTLEVERYLEGLVNHEFSSKWSEAAVEAQVVAARTYALYRIREESGNTRALYDLDSTEKDQVYGGAQKEDWLGTQAVARTRGLVLTAPARQDRLKLSAAAPVRSTARAPLKTVAPLLQVPAVSLNAVSPLKAYYHSTCGGNTELPEQVWGRKANGFKRRVHCSWCGDSPKFQWQATYTLRELETALRALGHPRAATARLESVRISKWSAGGRAERVEAGWRKPGAKGLERQEISAQNFRMKVGSSRLFSTWFNIAQDSRGGLVFSGRGYGHGVGLCQWGAKSMGARGFTTLQILSQYYPDAQVVRAW